MLRDEKTLLCQRCGEPVVVERDRYELFERMHWICFHLEFEHGEHDPDGACEDPSCPWNQIKRLREAAQEVVDWHRECYLSGAADFRSAREHDRRIRKLRIALGEDRCDS